MMKRNLAIGCGVLFLLALIAAVSVVTVKFNQTARNEEKMKQLSEKMKLLFGEEQQTYYPCSEEQIAELAGYGMIKESDHGDYGIYYRSEIYVLYSPGMKWLAKVDVEIYKKEGKRVCSWSAGRWLVWPTLP